MQNRVRRRVASFFACSMVFVSLAFAENPKPIHIQPGDLAAAFETLARQSGTEIVYVSAQVGALRTRGVSGSMTVREALQKLLKGTSFKVTVDSSGAMLITRPVQGSGTDVLGGASHEEAPVIAQAGQPESFHLVDYQTPSVGPGQDSASVKDKTAETGPALKDSQLDEIVVTGSRIARGALEQPTPITVINSASIEQSGFSKAGDILNQYSQFGVGTGLSTNQAGYNTDAGATFLNLRGLGTNRTLVLVDGLRRVSGGCPSSAVDLSTIPANMIERIEVITGGASSVYGADAVSGVVNIILKHHAEGLELSARSGISSRGDNATESVSATYGQPVQDRGELTFGISWNRENSLPAERRPWDRSYNCDFPNANVTASNPYTNIEYFGCRFPNTTYGSAFYIGDGTTQYTVNQDGSLRAV